MKQTKKLTIFIFAVLLFVLCGCDTVNTLLLQISGVKSDASYQKYVELRDNGELDEKGLYQSEELAAIKAAAAKKPDGTIHVTFAVNELIGFTYYRDEAMTEALDTNSCWLNPGDKIYVSAPDLSMAPVLYRFSHFLVRARVSEAAEWHDAATVETAPGLVYEIPADFRGTDISILPMGYYEKRKIILSARDGDEELRGDYYWTVNGEEYGNTTVEVDAQKTVEVVYHYGSLKDNYYFVSSDPECFFNKESDGTVSFTKTPLDKAEATYTVQFHPYASLLIHNGVEKKWIERAWDDAKDIFTGSDESYYELQNLILRLVQNHLPEDRNKLMNGEPRFDKLKAGDKFRIEVRKDMKLTGTGVTISQPTTLSDAREYIVTITDENCTNRNIAVTPRNSEDMPYKGKQLKSCTLQLTDQFDNIYVDGGEQPGENETIKVIIKPDDGMCLSGEHVNVKKNVYMNEMKYSDYLENFSEIIGNLSLKPCDSQ